jgi:hypothetical protein
MDYNFFANMYSLQLALNPLLILLRIRHNFMRRFGL